MHILAVIEDSSWVKHHIVGSLEDMGHTVHAFRYGEAVGDFYGAACAAQHKTRNAELVSLAQTLHSENRLDLIFCYVYDDFLTVAAARTLAHLGTPMVNLNVDMANQWYRQIRTARFFTRMLCAQKTNMEDLARYGARVFHFPMAARVPEEVLEPTAFAPAAPVTFLGTPTAFRVRVLSELAQSGIPLAVYGKFWLENEQAAPERSFEKTARDIYHYGWARVRAEGLGSLFRVFTDRFKHSSEDSIEDANLDGVAKHGFVPDGALETLFRKSKINLGFTRMGGDDPNARGMNQVKLRDFEVPAAGGFYLVEEAPDYKQLFKPGVEVETWRDLTELKEKIRRYLVDDDARERIRCAGRIRALRDHRWQNRFHALFDELGLTGERC